MKKVFVFLASLAFAGSVLLDAHPNLSMAKLLVDEESKTLTVAQGKKEKGTSRK